MITYSLDRQAIYRMADEEISRFAASSYNGDGSSNWDGVSLHSSDADAVGRFIEDAVVNLIRMETALCLPGATLRRWLSEYGDRIYTERSEPEAGDAVFDEYGAALAGLRVTAYDGETDTVTVDGEETEAEDYVRDGSVELLAFDVPDFDETRKTDLFAEIGRMLSLDVVTSWMRERSADTAGGYAEKTAEAAARVRTLLRKRIPIARRFEI